MKEVRLNDIGVTFKITMKDQDDVAIPIQTATVKKFYFRKPDGTEISVNASFFTDGSDGILVYQTIADQINQIGVWSLEPYVEITAGHFTGSTVKFLVKDIINN